MTLSVTAHSGATHQMADAWRRQTSLRRLYTAIGVGLLIVALGSTMWFADEANAGHFFDRLPHLLDFLSWLVPKDWNDVWRAMFDIASRMTPVPRNSTFRLAAPMSGAASTSLNISN